MEITCLGSGDAYGYERLRNSFLIEDQILLDCPPEILYELTKAEKEPAQIDYVFISHFHADHFFGLPFLFLEFRKNKREKDVSIIGPPNVEDKVENIFESGYPELAKPRNDGFQFSYLEAPPSTEYRLNNIVFQAFKMRHGSEEMLCLGYELKIGEKVIGYTGDTSYGKSLKGLAENGDLLITECSFPKLDMVNHMNFEKVKRLKGVMPKDSKIILTHLSAISPEMREEQDIYVAEDSKNYYI